MDLDPHTLLFSMLLVVFVVAGGCLLIWLPDRKEMAMCWMGIAAAMAGFALIGRLTLPFLPGVAFANSAMLVSFGMIWTAFRSLGNRRLEPINIALPIVAWFCFCFIPKFMTNTDLRLALSILLLLLPISLATYELWRNRQSSRIVRWPVLTVLGIQWVLMFQRAIRSLALQNVSYVPLTATPGFSVMMIDIMALMLILSFSLIVFVKDKSVRFHQENARYDFLTGVGNRLHFDNSLHQHFKSTKITNQPLSLIMLDVDLFKEYNDLYGHPVGDHCLRELASALVISCRPTDIVGRYGGEEFGILLPNTNLRVATAIADRILHRVRGLHIKHARRPAGIVTISLGVASVTPLLDHTTPADLVIAADRALYQAKNDGRDRVCWMSCE